MSKQISTAEAARRAGMDRRLIQYHCQKGNLRASKPEGFRDYLIAEKDLQEFLEQERKPGPKAK
jgi:excisionase family DNA binding protein